MSVVTDQRNLWCRSNCLHVCLRKSNGILINTTQTRTALGAEQPLGRRSCLNNVNVKRNNQYDICKWPWRSRSFDTIFEKVLGGLMIHTWWKVGDPSSKSWRVIAPTSPFWADLDYFSPKWPWRSRSINTIFNRVLERPKIHIWYKFGDPSSKTWQVITRTSPFFADFDRFHPKWPWKSRSINTIFNTVLEGPKINIWCKFGDLISET